MMNYIMIFDDCLWAAKLLSSKPVLKNYESPPANAIRGNMPSVTKADLHSK